MGADGRWVVVLPVKRLAGAKSRLRGAVPGVPHDTLALALARDTVAAVLGCPAVARVLVVTSDPRAAQVLHGDGARVLPDPEGGLNAAFAYGAGQVGGEPVAGLTADLPALRPYELAAALDAVTGRSFVADTTGLGTTLLASPTPTLDPRFGPGSAAAHVASGAVALAGDWPTLRRDVDTPADLAEAARLGLGTRTASLRVWPYDAGMQGTVATYDPTTRTGTVLLDDGTALDFGRAAFDAGGLRLLRLGQRLRIERDAAGQVSRVTLVTLS